MSYEFYLTKHKSGMFVRHTFLVFALLVNCTLPSLHISHEFEAYHEDGKMTSDILWHANVSSLVMCSVLCGKDQLCKTLSYERPAKMCTGHSKCPNDNEVSFCLGCVVMWNERYDCTTVETTTVTTVTLPVGPVCTEGSLGGMGGEPFDDESSASGKRITAMKIVCGPSHVEQILVRYDNTWISHPSGEERKIGHTLSYEFDDDEYITSVYGKTTNMITQITITTNQRTLPQCVADLADKDQEIASTHAGRRLMYISGREGGALDRLTFHWIC